MKIITTIILSYAEIFLVLLYGCQGSGNHFNQGKEKEIILRSGETANKILFAKNYDLFLTLIKPNCTLRYRLFNNEVYIDDLRRNISTKVCLNDFKKSFGYDCYTYTSLIPIDEPIFIFSKDGSMACFIEKNKFFYEHDDSIGMGKKHEIIISSLSVLSKKGSTWVSKTHFETNNVDKPQKDFPMNPFNSLNNP